MPRRSSWCWRCCGNQRDPPAGECSGVLVHFAVRHAAELRRLHALVTGAMKLDAFAGHLFVFANRRKDRVKILYWDRDGFAVWAKRLEEGTYAMPFGEEDEARREITAQELGALLSGIDLSTAKRRKRYRRASPEAA